MRLLLACLVATAACTDTPADDLDGVDELDPGPSLGKEDNAGISSIALLPAPIAGLGLSGTVRPVVAS